MEGSRKDKQNDVPYMPQSQRELSIQQKITYPIYAYHHDFTLKNRVQIQNIHFSKPLQIQQIHEQRSCYILLYSIVIWVCITFIVLTYTQTIPFYLWILIIVYIVLGLTLGFYFFTCFQYFRYHLKNYKITVREPKLKFKNTDSYLVFYQKQNQYIIDKDFIPFQSQRIDIQKTKPMNINLFTFIKYEKYFTFHNQESQSFTQKLFQNFNSKTKLMKKNKKIYVHIDGIQDEWKQQKTCDCSCECKNPLFIVFPFLFTMLTLAYPYILILNCFSKRYAINIIQKYKYIP